MRLLYLEYIYFTVDVFLTGEHLFSPEHWSLNTGKRKRNHMKHADESGTNFHSIVCVNNLIWAKSKWMVKQLNLKSTGANIVQPTEMNFFINVNCRIKWARDLQLGLTVLLKVFYHINGDKEDFLRKCSSKPKNQSFGNPPPPSIGVFVIGFFWLKNRLSY